MAKLDWYIRANLKLRQLQLLVALDEYRHLGKIALILNVTQPALSKSLGELQEGVGVRLFERNGRSLQPTPAGECLIRYARVVLKDLDEAGEELHGLISGHAGKLRIGVLPAAASSLLPKGLALFKNEAPGAPVFVRESTMDLLLQELRAGHIDLVIGTLPVQRSGADLEEKVLYDDPTVLIVGQKNALAARRKVRWLELANLPWILPPPDSLLRDSLLVTLHANGLDFPKDVIETLSSNVILNYVQVGNAVAALPASVALRYAELGMVAILPITLRRLVRPVGLTWQKNRAMTPAMQRFTVCMESVVKSLKLGRVGAS